MAILYSLRNSLNIAIIAMVIYRNSNVTKSGGTQCRYEDNYDKSIEETLLQQGGSFDWDQNVQGMVLGSFYYGYVVTNFVGGYFSERFGGKLVFGLGVFITTVLNLLSPVAAYVGYQYLFALRVIMGLAEGMTYPAVTAICIKWFTTTENALMYSIIIMGGRFGTLVASPLTAVLCESPGSWESSFYFFGGIGVVFSIGWFWITAENPSDHPTISQKELLYLTESQGDYRNIKVNIPWKELLTSPHTWIVVIAGFSDTWSFELLLICSPIFLNTILKFDLSSNALLNSLPNLVTISMIVLSGYLSKVIIAKRWLSVTRTRKLWFFIGNFFSSVMMLGVTFVGCDRTLVLLLLFGGQAISSVAVVGVRVAIMDIAPSYAGTIASLTNGLANFSGFLGPMMIGSLTNNNQTLEQWYKAFYITIAINMFCCLLFVIFGTAKLQSWGKAKELQEENDTTISKTSKTDITITRL